MPLDVGSRERSHAYPELIPDVIAVSCRKLRFDPNTNSSKLALQILYYS